MLLESDASVRMKARCGWNALHIAAKRGHDGVAAMLLERGAEVDEKV
jgi:ankyrin repeat protein